MYKWLAWGSSVLLLFFAFFFDIRFVKQSEYPPPPWMLGSLTLLLNAGIAYLADLGWRLHNNTWPAYRRHLYIFCVLAISWANGYFFFHVQSTQISVLLGLLGVFLGLYAGGLPFVFGVRCKTFSWKKGSNTRPDPSKPLVIVADTHWEDEMTWLHEATLAMPDADWLFLGDVFCVWVGVRAFTTDAQRNFLWWVAERRRTGHWVGLCLGNREFFLDCYAEYFDFICEGTNGTLQGESLSFEHGDLINTNDRHYRFWNMASRSLPIWLIAKLMPAFIGKKIASALERTLRQTNLAHKADFPAEEFQKALQECNSHHLITGHFHAFHKVENAFSVKWAQEGEFLVWRDGKFETVNFGK